MLTLLLFATIQSWRVNLPVAVVGKEYKATLSQKLSSCEVSKDVVVSPSVIPNIPSGLSITDDGTVTGTPKEQESAAYEFGVVCKEAKFIVRIRVATK